MYKKSEFGRELAEKIKMNIDIKVISNWAHEKFLDNANKIDSETYTAMMKLIAMEEGEEFVLSREELLAMANKLQEE